MALGDVQRTLARLFTDKAAREAFLADPQGASAALGLDTADAARLSAVAPQELRRFSASLVSKRALDAQKWTPLVAQALGARFGPLYAASVKGVADPAREAEAFAAHLFALAKQRKIEPAWIGDLARYEAARVAASRPRFIFRIRTFRYPVGTIAVALAHGAAVGEIKPRFSLGLWLRRPGGRLWTRYWSFG
jgi:hypothetical protein